MVSMIASKAIRIFGSQSPSRLSSRDVGITASSTNEKPIQITDPETFKSTTFNELWRSCRRLGLVVLTALILIPPAVTIQNKVQIDFFVI
jgi:hypothetical protein